MNVDINLVTVTRSFDAGVEFEFIEGGDDACFEVIDGGEEWVNGCGGFVKVVDGGCGGCLGIVVIVRIVHLHVRVLVLVAIHCIVVVVVVVLLSVSHSMNYFSFFGSDINIKY